MKTVVAYAKNIMHIMWYMYKYMHIYHYLVRSKYTVFNINKYIFFFKHSEFFMKDFCMH